MPDPSHRIRRRVASLTPREAHSDSAFDDLRYIRQTMESAASFTAVPGWGQLAIGATALLAYAVAHRLTAQSQSWLSIWLGEAALAVALGFLAMAYKARRSGVAMFAGPGRRFVLSFAPPLLVGAVLTAALARAGRFDLLPGTWLLLY